MYTAIISIKHRYAAEGTADTCLARVFSELGENAYAGAYAALGLLEQVSL